MKSAKVNTNSAKEVKTEETMQTGQLSLENVDELSIAIANSRFASLKNRELAIAGLALDANSARTFETIREKCKLYGSILRGELWREDGYKNFKDCADRLFRDNKGVAYMQASVGARFYADDATEIAAELGKYLSYSILDKLNKMNDSELVAHKADILKTDETGKVIGAITQKDADDLCKRVLATRSQSTDSKGGSTEGGSTKAEVVKMYDFHGYRVEYVEKEGTDEVLPTVHTIDRKNVSADALSDIIKGESKEHLFKFKTRGYHVAISEDGAIVVYTKIDHVEPKAESTKSNMTAFKYDGIARGHANKVPAEVVAMMMELDVETVKKVYDSLDRAAEVKGETEG